MLRICDAEVIDSTCFMYTAHSKAQGIFGNSKQKECMSQSIEKYTAKINPLYRTYSPFLNSIAAVLTRTTGTQDWVLFIQILSQLKGRPWGSIPTQATIRS